MTIEEKERALKLVNMLKKAGENHGLLVVAGNLVIRDGVNGSNSPMMFDVSVLENAIALGLLEQRRVSGSVAWDWYVPKS
jgi:hypothetical protein